MTEVYIKPYLELMVHPLWEDKPFSKGQAKERFCDPSLPPGLWFCDNNT